MVTELFSWAVYSSTSRTLFTVMARMLRFCALSTVPEAEMCGWVKDRFGLSWQIVPRRLTELMVDPDPARARAAMQAMMDMRRIDIAALERAVAGVPAG